MRWDRLSKSDWKVLSYPREGGPGVLRDLRTTMSEGRNGEAKGNGRESVRFPLESSTDGGVRSTQGKSRTMRVERREDRFRRLRGTLTRESNPRSRHARSALSDFGQRRPHNVDTDAATRKSEDFRSPASSRERYGHNTGATKIGHVLTTGVWRLLRPLRSKASLSRIKTNVRCGR